MLVVALTDPIDDGHQRGGLARTGWTDYQSKPLFLGHLLTDGLDYRWRKTNLVEWGDPVGDQTNGHSNPLMGEMSLNAESPYSQHSTCFFAFSGEVDLPL